MVMLFKIKMCEEKKNPKNRSYFITVLKFVQQNTIVLFLLNSMYNFFLSIVSGKHQFLDIQSLQVRPSNTDSHPAQHLKFKNPTNIDTLSTPFVCNNKYRHWKYMVNIYKNQALISLQIIRTLHNSSAKFRCVVRRDFSLTFSFKWKSAPPLYGTIANVRQDA